MVDGKDLNETAAERIERQTAEKIASDKGTIINFEDVSATNLARLPLSLTFGKNQVSVAKAFLTQFKTFTSHKRPDKTVLSGKMTKYKADIKKLIVDEIKMFAIDHDHLTDWLGEYYARMAQIVTKYGFDHPFVNYKMLTPIEQNETYVYMYTKKLIELLEGPRVAEFLDTMKEAALDYLKDDEHFDITTDPDTKQSFKDLHVAIKNFPKELDIHEINADYLNKAMDIKGNLVSYDDKRRVEIMTSWWLCNDCGQSFDVMGANRPTKCRLCGEKTGFTDLPELFVNENYIFIKIQQHMNTDQTQIGVTDLVVKVAGNNLISHFYQKMKPAANLNITGIVKLSSERTNRNNPNERLIQLNAITVDVEGENTVMQYSERLLDAIRGIDIRYIEQHFEKLVRSICPHLYGQDIIKRGILFQAAGAEPRIHGDSKTRVRGDINIMLIGDSSQGKSDYGIFLLKILPQSIRTIGGQSTTTKAALTTSVEIVNGIKVVTFGVLPLCDRRGVAIIDELDKRSKEDFEILSYPMDDNQCIPTHKSGFHHEVNARCPVLLIGNPSKNHGKWDPSKPLEAQTNFANWFTARVDLIFVMFDDGNMERRAAMVEHISKTRSKMIIESEFESTIKNKTISDAEIERIESDFRNNRFDGVYSTEYLRHELHVLKSYKPLIKPGSESERIVKKEWLKFSSISMTMDFDDGTVAINPMMDTRKYSTMERLSMAAARLRRHSTVQREDVEEAVKLMTYSATTLMPQPKQDTLSPSGLADMQRLIQEGGSSGISRALTSEIIKRRENIARTMRSKLGGFNKILFSTGNEICLDCRGHGTINTATGIEKCMGCKGRKLFPRNFTYVDFEMNIMKKVAMEPKECNRIFREYIKHGVIKAVGGQRYSLVINTVDSVEIGEFVEKLANQIAKDLTRNEFEKEFGVPDLEMVAPRRASEL